MSIVNIFKTKNEMKFEAVKKIFTRRPKLDGE